ncbi:hypothetical protein ACFOYU_12780 [Microvirga sp. GCM10011540]|uniref:hypothetical protein n=1 Tax=Microvirga sp. GCM10011540 TaxID=3317338 RepID=UPI00362194FE
MSRILKIEAELLELSEQKAALQRKMKELHQARRKESFRLQAQVERLLGAAYLAAREAGAAAFGPEEVLSHAERIAGAREATALGQLRDCLAAPGEAVDGQAMTSPAPLGERA